MIDNRYIAQSFRNILSAKRNIASALRFILTANKKLLPASKSQIKSYAKTPSANIVLAKCGDKCKIEKQKK